MKKSDQWGAHGVKDDDMAGKINDGQRWILWIFEGVVGTQRAPAGVMDHTADGSWLCPHLHSA